MAMIKRYTVGCNGCPTTLGVIIPGETGHASKILRWWHTSREARAAARANGWTIIGARTPLAGGSSEKHYCTNCRGGRA